MKRTGCVLFIILLFYSCEKENTPPDCTKDRYVYEFYAAAKIDTATIDNRLFFQVTPGTDMVFSYTHIGPDCKTVVDEEYTDNLVFKVPGGSNSFLYQNNQLQDAMCMFIKHAFWTNGAYKITSGFVKGTKISSAKWGVEINVDVGGFIGRVTLKKTFIPH